MPVAYEDLEALFTVSAAAAPCGPNLEYDPIFLEIERTTPARPAGWEDFPRHWHERPDWWRVTTLARALLAQSKDLRLAVYLLRGLVATEGLIGLPRGLYVIERLVRDCWTCLYPELEEGDPTWRLNTLAALSDPDGLLRELHDVNALFTGDGALTVREVIALQRTDPTLLALDDRRLLHFAQRDDVLREIGGEAAGCLERLRTSLVRHAGPAADSSLRGLQQLVDDLRGAFVARGPREDTPGGDAAGMPSGVGVDEPRSRDSVSDLLRTGYVGFGGEDVEPLPAEEAAPPLSGGTYFRVIRPLAIRPGTWNAFLVYLHSGQSATVDADSVRRLGEAREAFERDEAPAAVTIARGAEITIVPEIAGCRFNPRQQRIEWLEDVHAVEFRVQATPEAAGFVMDRRLYGHVRVYVGPLLVGAVPTSIVATSAGGFGEPLPVDGAAARPFARVFVSYAHEDRRIVDLLQRAYELVRIDYLRDVTLLRSGDRWNPQILDAIDRADRFQLCWSAAASRSEAVEQEWRRALARQTDARAAFICPCYWERPMPAPPPELSDLHFAYFEI